MDYIPNPTELMESRIDELAYQYGMLNRDAPAGKFVCPYCRQLRDGEPIMLTGAPDSPAMCYECLPDDVKKAWDKFESERQA